MNVKAKAVSRARFSLNYPPRAYGIALVIIFAAATGPIAIKQTQLVGVPSLYIITARLLLTSLILAPYIFRRHPQVMGTLSNRDWAWLILAALTFALNLLFLFLALEYTSVLVTSVLRRTTPLWVIWLEIILLGAVFTRSVWLGLGLTLVGSVAVGLGSGTAIDPGSNPILGMSLALIGSLSIGIYLLVGRKFSERLPSLLYSWLVFTAAGFMMLAAVIVTGTPLWGYGLEGYIWILIVTFISQILGHIPINMGLRYFPATYMSLILQLAVVASAVIAIFAFGEIPSLLQIVGSGLILAGVALVNWK